MMLRQMYKSQKYFCDTKTESVIGSGMMMMMIVVIIITTMKIIIM